MFIEWLKIEGIAVENWKYQKTVMSWCNGGYAHQFTLMRSTCRDHRHNSGHEDGRQRPNRRGKSTAEVAWKYNSAYKVWPPRQGVFHHSTTGKLGGTTQHRAKKHKREEYEHPAHKQECTLQRALNHDSNKKCVSMDSSAAQDKEHGGPHARPPGAAEKNQQALKKRKGATRQCGHCSGFTHQESKVSDGRVKSRQSTGPGAIMEYTGHHSPIEMSLTHPKTHPWHRHCLK